MTTGITYSYKFLSLIYIFIDIIALLFYKWFYELLQILFYIVLISTFIINIFLNICVHIKYEIKIENLNNYKYYKFFYILFSVLLIIMISFTPIKPVLMAQNVGSNYLKECPFTFQSELNRNKIFDYEKRRCELYNIYNNSRYRYQYICSYDASKDFQSNKTEDGLNKIICIKKRNSAKNNNNIINRFVEIYSNNSINNFFYCSRTNKPNKSKNTKEKYCNSNYYILVFLSFLNMLNIGVIYTQILVLEIIVKNHNNLVEERNNNINNFDSSTECGDDNPNNISFKKEKDRNIIVENHKEYSIEVNIKDFLENEKISNQNTNVEDSTIENILNDSEHNK